MRAAIVTGGSESLSHIQAYMPENYKVARHYVDVYDERVKRRSRGWVYIIVGEDVAGWTLDGYVIPRLASGLIFAEEIE